MIEWGQKSKPKKIPRASDKTPKNPWDRDRFSLGGRGPY